MADSQWKGVDEVLSVYMSFLENGQLFHMMCKVDKRYVGLMKRKGSPEVKPLRPESETKGSILDLLQFRGASGSG